jgi:N-methylhydantoinase B/oxoprolinase/acetone carboxylase alpha subunit
LGDLGVIKQRKFEVIGMEIKILIKNVLKPPYGLEGGFLAKLESNCEKSGGGSEV